LRGRVDPEGRVSLDVARFAEIHQDRSPSMERWLTSTDLALHEFATARLVPARLKSSPENRRRLIEWNRFEGGRRMVPIVGTLSVFPY